MATDKTGEGRVGRGLTDHLYVDVDDTLLSPAGGTIVNTVLVEELRKWFLGRRKAGGQPQIVIWTMGGAARAEQARQLCGFPGSWCLCIAKPDLIIDNGGHDWFYRRFKVVLPAAFKAPA